MRILEQLRSECEACPDVSRHAEGVHPILFRRAYRRVFRLACIEANGYQADLDANIRPEMARERFCERVEAKYREMYRVDEAPPETDGGPYGFITIAVVIGLLISSVVSWVIWKMMDAIWEWWQKRHPKATQAEAVMAFAIEAEQTSAGDE